MITRPITRSITRAITRSITGVETIVFIEREAAANAYFSLSPDWVATGDYSIEQYVYFTGDLIRLSGNLSNANNSALINADGSIDWKADLSSATVSTTASTVPVNELSLIKVKRVGAVGTVHVNGTLALTATVPTGTLSVNTFDNQNGSVSGGLQAKPKLTDLSTSANSLVFTLGELTANSEVNNGVTLTYNNIATTRDVRDTYTLTDGAWLGTDFGATSATAVNAPWVSNGGSSYSIDGSQAAQTTIFYDSFLSTPATYVVEITTTNSTAGGVRPETSEIELAYSTGNTTTRWEFTTISNGNFNIQADANYDGNITYTIRNKIDIAAQAPTPTALFNSSGVLTCSGTLDCASTIPCGA
jgi:hypothetical protein